MAFSRRIIIIVTSILLLFILAVSLLTSIEVRAPPRNFVQVSLAQAQKVEQSDRDLTKGKAKINGSDFDRASIYPAPTVYLSDEPTPVSEPTRIISLLALPTGGSSLIDQEDGMIGLTKTLESSPTSIDQGYIGPIVTSSSSTSQSSASAEPEGPAQAPAQSAQLPILALTYTGSSGPKHCRGDLIERLEIPSTLGDAPSTKEGQCISLPAMARCGVFFAGKESRCQADLFSSENCVNNTRTYVNTVVFMPEERSVGAYWRSMWIKCGVEAPEAQLLDPAILGDLVRKPGE